MVNQYKWLTIRFEYSDSYRCFLVSFYYSKSIDDDNEFYKEVLDFEKKMADNCSDDILSSSSLVFFVLFLK